MSITQAYLLRYHEVALKGQNRGKFEDLMMRNARKAVELIAGKQPELKILRSHGRVLAFGVAPEIAAQAFTKVFGITGLSPLRIVETSTPALIDGAVAEFEAYVARAGLPSSFRVTTRRSEKAVPETSEELNRRIGSAIQARHPGLRVELKSPALTLGVEIRDERSFIWSERISGAGGLPVGCNSPVLALMSGGLDSPVAAIRMLRRGCPVSFIHFSGEPFVGPAPLEKVEDLVRLVNRYQPAAKPLVVVPFGKIQEEIALATNPKLRTILYRRMMFRIAGRVAQTQGIQALVTGESMGQVASQTLDNLSVINRASPHVVLRPLLGMDKDEIIGEAKRWGTFETSIRPGIDCCTLFSDRHPAIRANPHIVEEQERCFDVEALVERALALSGIDPIVNRPAVDPAAAAVRESRSGSDRGTPSFSPISSPELQPTS